MGLVIDTCVFIQAEKKGCSVDLSQWKDEPIYISAITASELLVGVHRAGSKSIMQKRLVFVNAILQRVPILDFTLETARVHAELCAHLLSQGNIIGSHDLIIAATALEYSYMVITNNQREFNRVPGLKTECF